MDDYIKIVIGSDVCPTKNDSVYFEDGNINAILPEFFVELFRNSDFSLVNVECPFTENSHPINKLGPPLKASPACINFFSKLGISAASFANNHILDYGEKSLQETLDLFRNNQIDVVGAGKNLYEAIKPLIKKFSCGRSLAIFAMAETEFCIAGEISAGANPISFKNYTLIKKTKYDVDKIIVILHAGTELRELPRPGLIDLCHFLVDQGADVVIVQHTHCVGCLEYYNNAIIFYGQGNFIFGNYDEKNDLPSVWWEGVLIELIWSRQSDDLKLNLYPFMQQSESFGLRLLTDAELKFFGDKHDYFNSLVNNREEVISSWNDFCVKSVDRVLLNIMGANRLFRALSFRGFPLVKIWLRFVNHLRINNMISCESHRELLLDVLRLLKDK